MRVTRWDSSPVTGLIGDFGGSAVLRKRRAIPSILWAMAGTVDVLMRCPTRMRARRQVLRFDPAMPPQIKQLRFSVHYRGQRVEHLFSQNRLEVSSRAGPAAPTTVLVREQTVELHAGAAYLLIGLGDVTGVGRDQR